jgi:hypothetical protein
MDNWNTRCSNSILEERKEVETKYAVRIGQTEIYCSRCGKPWGYGGHVCQDIRFEMMQKKREEIRQNARNLKNRTANIREEFSGRSGYLKINPSRPETKRASLGKSGRKSLLPRTDLHGVGVETQEKGLRSLPDRHGTVTDHAVSKCHNMPDRGIGESDEKYGCPCSGVFCGVISQEVSWCHKREG